MCTRAQAIAALSSVMVLAGLAGCQKPVEEYNQPLTYWADPKQAKGQDGCVYATAQAILKSGLPYPRIGTETIQLADGRQETRNTTVDVWVGNTRFVLPAKLVKSDGGYPTNRPERYWKLGGSLPHFWPAGEPGPNVDGMGSMVDITIRCSVEPAYVASWGKGYLSNAEGIEKVHQKYLDNIKILAPERRDKASVTTNVRQDLGMTEVLFDRAGVYTDGQPQWEASYWPLSKELKGPSGNISGVGCDNVRHDILKRYGNRGWRCGVAIRITPEAVVSIDIYVSQLQHLPAIFEQVRQLFESAKQN
jgi:hypothetical protein